MSLVLAGITATLRTETRLASARVEQIEARAAAGKGIVWAATKLGLEGLDALPNENPVAFHFGERMIKVIVSDEMAKIDLNHADETVLAGLFQALGETEERAAQLAAFVAD